MIRRMSLLVLVLFALALSAGALEAQPGPEGQGGPEIGPGGPGMPHGGPGGPGGPGMGPRGKGKPDPAEIARKQRLMAMKSTAEAYKNLADMYQEQGKIDEAVAELRKILDLTKAIDLKIEPQLAFQIGGVYLEIAECYLKKDKFAEAEAIVNEGYERVKSENPEMASRMSLFLGNAYRKAGKTAEAEKFFKRVIDLNAAVLNQPAAGK